MRRQRGVLLQRFVEGLLRCLDHLCELVCATQKLDFTDFEAVPEVVEQRGGKLLPFCLR